MTTCVIGNSHAGSILKAYKRLDTPPDPAWQFFVTPNGYKKGAGLRAIRFDPEQRVFTGFPFSTAGEDGSLPVADYDRFVLIGAHPSPADVAAMLETPMSAAFRAAAIETLCRTARLGRLAETLRKVTDAPVYLMTKPAFPAERRAAPAGLPMVEAAIAAYWQTRGITVIAQPAQTLDDDGLTRSDLFVGADNGHLRPAAAALALEAIRAALV